MTRTFYRIVKHNPPRRQDFISNFEKRGKVPPDLPSHLLRLWDGLSVHETEAHAQRQARETPWLGSFIAEVSLPEQALPSVRWERTIPRNPGHYTLWGNADDLLLRVSRTLPI
jgi:hypothetical protein